MKPFGQPVTEIFDFEEGSRFAVLTVAKPVMVDIQKISLYYLYYYFCNKSATN